MLFIIFASAIAVEVKVALMAVVVVTVADTVAFVITVSAIVVVADADVVIADAITYSVNIAGFFVDPVAVVAFGFVVFDFTVAVVASLSVVESSTPSIHYHYNLPRCSPPKSCPG